MAQSGDITANRARSAGNDQRTLRLYRPPPYLHVVSMGLSFLPLVVPVQTSLHTLVISTCPPRYSSTLCVGGRGGGKTHQGEGGGKTHQGEGGGKDTSPDFHKRFSDMSQLGLCVIVSLIVCSGWM